MGLWRQLARGVRVLTSRHRADRELDEEVRHYMEAAGDAYRAQGLSPEEARRAVRQEFGDAIAVREQVRDDGWENVLATAWTDLRLSVRLLRKSPIFTVVVLLAISLGCGAVTTIFSAMNALVLRPLPGVSKPGELVSLRPAARDGSVAEQASYQTYTYLRDHTQMLAGTAAWGRVALTISAGGEGVAVAANMVSGNYFDVLGVRAAAGRFFSGSEDVTPGAHPVIVVSHAFSAAHLGGLDSSVGRVVSVNGLPFTVIGVAPAAFHGIYTGINPDAWIPLMMQPQLRPRMNLTSSSWLWMFGRLEPGVTAAAAAAELGSIKLAHATELGIASRPDARVAIRLEPLTGLPGGEGGPLLGFLSLMLGAAALVLAIAGVNVAAMFSARYIARRREMAVRAALGAGRGRLLRQLLVEVLTLFVLGAAGGLALTFVATAALEQLPLPQNVAVSLELSPDLRVFAFALAVSMCAGVIFGLAPAFQAARRDITSHLRDDNPGSGARRTVFSRALIAGQLALSLTLLVASGLFFRALDAATRADPGFDRSGVLLTTLEPEAWGYDEAKARAFYRTLRARLDLAAGVTAVAETGRIPLMMGASLDDITTNTGTLQIQYAAVGADYFSILRMPIVRGRAFTGGDDRGAGRVAIVNETLAARIAAGGSAVGGVLRFRGQPVTVVGVARDAKYATLTETTPPFAYFPIDQVWQPTQTLLMRVNADTADLRRAIEEAVLSIDPRAPRPRVSTLERATGIVVLPQRAAAIVTGGLGAIGLLLATVGLYGVMAFSAGRRTREMGIRMALGAARSSLMAMVLREGMTLAGLGIAGGLLLAALVGRLLEKWLFTVSPFDALTFAAMATCFTITALVAVYLPARRAAAADPLRALRSE